MLFGIFISRPNILELFGDPRFWLFLTIDSWELVTVPLPALLPLTIGVELVPYLVSAWYWLRVGGSHVNWGKVVLSCFTVNIISWYIIATLGYNITVLSYSAYEASFTMFPIVFDVTVLLVIIIALCCFNRMGVLREK